MSIAVQLDAFLRPLGFVRRGSRWNRRVSRCVDVIELQISKGKTAMTVNVGVLNIDVFQIFYSRPVPNSVAEPYCTARSRLGELMGNATDKWWDLSTPDLASVIGESLVNYAPPFLASMHEVENMLDYIHSPARRMHFYALVEIQAILLEYVCGDHEGACRILSELFESYQGPWREKIGDIVMRLGCPKDGQDT